MPHSNDRTLITAAGDHEVRIFDIEYSGSSTEASTTSTLAANGRRRARASINNGLRYLSDGNTNCRVYRSHGDRVKRIVTESSPHLFLTCSEDGEVRQWDLRQPSSTYPSPSRRYGEDNDTTVPPPLISYKKFNLDLNTISCSPSQPHYIALGGAHLHCFLHDRRMTGRDILTERGATPLSAAAMSEDEEDLMGQATRCVKKFAPHGKSRMRRTDNGHITACKISDAHPNEMIVSWSGDHIYSFDLIRSPDAAEQVERVSLQSSSTANGPRARESGERKRKRKAGSQVSLSHEGTSRAESRQRTESQEGDMALRVQYGNGQCEEIPIEPLQSSNSPISSLRESVLNERQRRSYRLAKSVVKLRKSTFTLETQANPSETDPTGHASSFGSVLSYATSIYPQMLEISSAWRYPVDPAVEDVLLQRTLRSRRDSACRFVQASGVIARALGGRLRTTTTENTPSPHFNAITFSLNEGPDISEGEMFGYDFLKAIFLWLDSGVGALLEGFASASPVSRNASRLPVPKNSGMEAIDEALIPYLLDIASDHQFIANVDASRFEIDENRVIFATEKEAVLAFAEALKVPFADLSSASGPSSESTPTTSRRDALMHWGFKVARGVLMNAGEGVNFAFVDSAFGGLGSADPQTLQEEATILTRQEEIDPSEEEPAIRSFEITNEGSFTSPHAAVTEEERDAREMDEMRAIIEEHEGMEDDESDAEDQILFTPAERAGATDSNDEAEDEENTDSDSEEDENEDADTEDGEVDGEDDDDDEEEEEEEDEEAAFHEPTGYFRSRLERQRLRESVGENVPCVGHTRIYRGHCNVRTVKDVNFFGLDDEYVVSGSDDGNLFIWDRKSGQLVNILEGDGEVVNVLQGHPYEPLLAVSGIDHTIKVFSPDTRAREAARLGRGIEAADASAFSSISLPGRIRGRRLPRQQSSSATTSEPAMPSADEIRRRLEQEDDDDFVAPSGLASRKRMHEEYQIVSRNDADRQGGNTETYITVSTLAVSFFSDRLAFLRDKYILTFHSSGACLPHWPNISGCVDGRAVATKARKAPLLAKAVVSLLVMIVLSCKSWSSPGKGDERKRRSNELK